MCVIAFANQRATGRSLTEAVDYILSPDSIGCRGIYKGVLPRMPVESMELIKALYRKHGGRQYVHIIISPRNCNLTPEAFRNVIDEIILWFSEYQMVASVHVNTKHMHSHVIVSSVNFRTGRKFQQSIKDMEGFKEHCRKILASYGIDEDVSVFEDENDALELEDAVLTDFSGIFEPDEDEDVGYLYGESGNPDSLPEDDLEAAGEVIRWILSYIEDGQMIPEAFLGLFAEYQFSGWELTLSEAQLQLMLTSEELLSDERFPALEEHLMNLLEEREYEKNSRYEEHDFDLPEDSMEDEWLEDIGKVSEDDRNGFFGRYDVYEVAQGKAAEENDRRISAAAVSDDLKELIRSVAETDGAVLYELDDARLYALHDMPAESCQEDYAHDLICEEIERREDERQEELAEKQCFFQ